MSNKNYDSGDSNFDPTLLINDINSIVEGNYVLIGIKEDGAFNMTTEVYNVL